MRSKRSRRAAVTVAMLAGLLVMFAAPAALAVTELATPPKDLNTVINNITAWLVGLLVALATLFLTVGGIRYLLAGGDPGEVNKAKETHRRHLVMSPTRHPNIPSRNVRNHR